MKSTSPSNALLSLRDDAHISHADFTAVAAASASSVLSEQDAECMLAGSSMALHTKYAGMRVSFERELNDAQTRGAGGRDGISGELLGRVWLCSDAFSG